MKRVFVMCAVAALVGLGSATYVLAQGPARADRPQDVLSLDGFGSAIGISIRDLTAEEASRLKDSGGVMVSDVMADTPASRAGMRSGDIIVEFDGETIRSARQFARVVRESRPGRAVKATVMRDGSRQVLDVTPEDRTSELLSGLSERIERGLRSLPRDFALDFDLPRDVAIIGGSNIGATLSTLSPQLAGYFGVKGGALVSSVAPDSRAAQAGLKAGDVITKVGGTDVERPADVTRNLRRARPDASIELTIVRDKKEMTLTVAAPESRRVPRPRGAV